MDCLFCKIAKKEINAEIVYEDASAIGFLDINPRADGHTVIIPKEHVENILGLNDKSIESVFLSVKKIAAALKKTLKPDGFTIGINHGKAAGQVIDHLHIHIIPRFKNDLGGSIQSIVNSPSKKIDLREMTLKIKKQLIR